MPIKFPRYVTLYSGYLCNTVSCHWISYHPILPCLHQPIRLVTWPTFGVYITHVQLDNFWMCSIKSHLSIRSIWQVLTSSHRWPWYTGLTVTEFYHTLCGDASNTFRQARSLWMKCLDSKKLIPLAICIAYSQRVDISTAVCSFLRYSNRDPTGANSVTWKQTQSISKSKTNSRKNQQILNQI